MGIRNPGYSLRMRLLVVGLLAVAPIAVLAFWNGYSARSAARRQAVNDMFRLTQLAAADQARLINDTALILSTIAETTKLEARKTDCSDPLVRIAREHPGLLSVALFDRNGRFRCGSEPEGGMAASQPEFIRRTNATAVSFTSNDTERAPLFLVAQPIWNDRGDITHVLVAANRLTSLVHLRSALGLPEGATLSIIEGSTVVARHPAPDRWLGRTADDLATGGPLASTASSACSRRLLSRPR